MLRYKTETRPGLVTLYDIQPGNRAGHSYNPGASMRLIKKARQEIKQCFSVFVSSAFRREWVSSGADNVAESMK